MNIKKILAAVTASVLSVTATAVVASAAMVLEPTTAKGGGGILPTKIDFSSLTEDQVKSVTKIEAIVSSDTNFFKGIIGYNSVAKADWDSGSEVAIGDGNSETYGIEGKFVREFEAGDLAALDDDGNVAPYAEVQFWWVNGIEYDGSNISKDGTVCIKAVKVYAGDEVILTLGDPDAVGPEANAAAEEPGDGNDASDSTPDTTTPDDTSKPNTETGVAGVATVVGVAVVAAGAMVVSKKRK